MVSLGFLAAAATGAMWRSPGVFPVSSAAFWSSTGLVGATWLLVGVAALAALLPRPALLLAAWWAPAGVLLGLSIAGRVFFPATTPRLWAGGALLGILWALTAVRTFRARSPGGRALAVVGLLLGVPWGVTWATARRPGLPGTRPALATLPAPAVQEPVPGVTLHGAHVQLPCGAATLELHPLLTFLDSSRDGFWPGVAPTAFEGTPALEGPRRRASLHVSAVDAGVLLEAATELPVPVHSHLNRFTALWLDGVAQPGVRFAAMGPEVFSLEPFDYPRGRPARFAAWHTTGELRVAQARDAEKGPFTTLARGPLPSGGPLTLELFDGPRHLCTLSFLDFTAQADGSPSPTAGEGVPVNVVQFGVPARAGARPAVHLSLAETGIGAGRDTVTHAPGVYRNRVLVSPGGD